MRDFALKKSLTKLKLDEQKAIGYVMEGWTRCQLHCPPLSSSYTFKAMGAGFYGLRLGTDFKKTITELIMEAGDADRSVSPLIQLSHSLLDHSPLNFSPSPLLFTVMELFVGP